MSKAVNLGTLADDISVSNGDVSLNITGHLIPATNDVYDIGSTTAAIRNIYTGDLHLSNQNKTEGNSVDGTKGTWTIQEGEEDLFIINNKTGKKYAFALKEIE